MPPCAPASATSSTSEFPIFAFTHCRDVVAAVSTPAASASSDGRVHPEQLATELEWLDEHCHRPTASTSSSPEEVRGWGLDPVKLEAELQTLVPEEHKDFARKLLADHEVPELPADQIARPLIGWTEATASPLIDEALRHDGVKLIANALGTPPPEVIERIHGAGRLVAAVALPAQAMRHKNAGHRHHHHRPGHRAAVHRRRRLRWCCGPR